MLSVVQKTHNLQWTVLTMCVCSSVARSTPHGCATHTIRTSCSSAQPGLCPPPHLPSPGPRPWLLPGPRGDGAKQCLSHFTERDAPKGHRAAAGVRSPPFPRLRNIPVVALGLNLYPKRQAAPEQPVWGHHLSLAPPSTTQPCPPPVRQHTSVTTWHKRSLEQRQGP